MDQDLFTFYLQSDDKQDGELLIGDIDSSHYNGDLWYTPLIHETYYMISLNSASMNGNSITTVTKAIIDSGTSLLVGPTTEVAAVAESIGATEVESGEYEIDCSTTILGNNGKEDISNVINYAWYYTVLNMIGNNFGNYQNICGVVVNL